MLPWSRLSRIEPFWIATSVCLTEIPGTTGQNLQVRALGAGRCCGSYTGSEYGISIRV